MIQEIKETNITEREIRILKAINIFGRVDSSFLREAFFEESTKAAGKVGVSRAVKKLEKLNLITSKDWVKGAKVYGLGKSSKTALEKIFNQKFYGKRSLGFAEMEHDIIVSKIFLTWRKKGYVKIHTERMLKKSGVMGDSIPDLLTFNHEGEKVFIEVETSPKTTERYLKKLYQFNEVDNLKAVNFYVQSENIQRMIQTAQERAGKLRFSISIKSLAEELL